MERILGLNSPISSKSLLPLTPLAISFKPKLVEGSIKPGYTSFPVASKTLALSARIVIFEAIFSILPLLTCIVAFSIISPLPI